VHRLRAAHDRNGTLESWPEDMDDMVREGVASFKLFHGVSQRIDGGRRHDLQRIQQTAKNGALICMHARTGRDRCDCAAGVGRGKDCAGLSRADAADEGRGRSCASRRIAIGGNSGVRFNIVHLSSEDALNQVREARDRGLPAFAETCRSTCCSRSKTTWTARAGRARSMCLRHRFAKRRPAEALGGSEKDNLQVVSTDHCPFVSKIRRQWVRTISR